MKKKLLFVNESLILAGGEKSLIALLSNLDPELYEIDLQLFRYGGALDKMIPNYVNVLPPLGYMGFADKSLSNNLLSLWRRHHFAYLKARVQYSLALRRRENYNHPEKAQLFWEAVGKVFPQQRKEYDVAIAYAQGVPTFYVMDKVRAEKNVAWVNANLTLSPKNKAFNYQYYNKYDTIVPVSVITCEQIGVLFPAMRDKLYTIYDMIDYGAVLKMSDLHRVSFRKEQFNILTVSRLNNKQKGMDITLDTCRILRDKGIDFHWYVIGTGDFQSTMEDFIREHQLENYLTLLGTTANPYPYFKAADLYVQTSRHEGFGLSIAEARLLNTPVVTTRFDAVFIQMKHEVNGLVMDMNAESVAEAIIRIKEDKALYDWIVENLKREPKENLESVDCFNKLIQSL